MPIDYRQATLDDAQEISDLCCEQALRLAESSLAESFVQAEFGVEAIRSYITRQNNSKRISKTVKSSSHDPQDTDSYQLLVALYQSWVVGVVIMKNTSHIHGLFVKDDYKGHGTGKSLLILVTGMENSERHKGTFKVNAPIQAVDFFKKCEFECATTEQPTLENGFTYISMQGGIVHKLTSYQRQLLVHERSKRLRSLLLTLPVHIFFFFLISTGFLRAIFEPETRLLHEAYNLSSNDDTSWMFDFLMWRDIAVYDEREALMDEFHCPEIFFATRNHPKAQKDVINKISLEKKLDFFKGCYQAPEDKYYPWGSYLEPELQVERVESKLKLFGLYEFKKGYRREKYFGIVEVYFDEEKFAKALAQEQKP